MKYFNSSSIIDCVAYEYNTYFIYKNETTSRHYFAIWNNKTTQKYLLPNDYTNKIVASSGSAVVYYMPGTV